MGNGVRGDLQELAAECRQLKTFHLRLQRPRDVSNSKLFAEYAPTVPRKNVVQGKSTSQFHDDFCSSSPSEVSVSECASRPQSQGAQSPKPNSGGPRGDSEAPFLRCGPPLPEWLLGARSSLPINNRYCTRTFLPIFPQSEFRTLSMTK